MEPANRQMDPTLPAACAICPGVARLIRNVRETRVQRRGKSANHFLGLKLAMDMSFIMTLNRDEEPFR